MVVEACLLAHVIDGKESKTKKKRRGEWSLHNIMSTQTTHAHTKD